MEDNLSIRKAFHDALSPCEGQPLRSDEASLSLYYDICCGCVLLAEADLKGQRRYWEPALLAGTFLHYAGHLEGFDHMLDQVYPAVTRMTDCVHDHKRLRLRLLRLQLTVVRRLEALHGHDQDMGEGVEAEMARTERNIRLADAGRLDEISEAGHLRHDPLEWTLAYEQALEDVEREADVLLAGQPRGMGFCLAYWQVRALALRCHGLEWRSPSVMNPRVMFD